VKRILTLAMMVALIGVPLAAGSDGVCARMPCCSREKVKTSLKVPTCCSEDNCAVAPWQVPASAATNATHFVNLAVVSNAVAEVHFSLSEQSASLPAVFCPPPARKLSLLSVLQI
jgi:hypothetical protein